MRRLPLRSPPRVRGKVRLMGSALPVTGITPACAGKRCLGHLFQVELRDHPRVCGEKDAQGNPLPESLGLPPRMRGKVKVKHHPHTAPRITPACAGKSSPGRAPALRRRDHPRVCGEKITRWADRPRTLGSPPRVRGKATRQAGLLLPAGITPACAGKSLRCAFVVSPGGDHPRVCGEKPLVVPPWLTSRESPPRVRGKADAKSSGRYSRPLHGTPVSLDALR